MASYKIICEREGSRKPGVLVSVLVQENPIFQDEMETNEEGVALWQRDGDQLAWTAEEIDDDWVAEDPNPANMNNQQTFHTFEVNPV